MRILYVWAEARTRVGSSGGDSVHVRETIRALRSVRHNVDVASGAELALTPEVKDVYRRVRQWLPLFARHAGRELYETLQDRRMSQHLATRLRVRAYDGVYERYSPFHACGVRAARAHGLPAVLEVNGTMRETAEYYGLALKGRAARVERAAFTDADAIVVVSSALRTELVEAGVPPAKIDVIPNGVAEDLFAVERDGAEIRRTWGLGSGFVVAFVGSFAPWHDLPTLLVAFARLSVRADVRLLLVGDGPRAAVDSLIRQLGIGDRVVMTGAVPHEAVPDYIAASDVAIAPYPRIGRFHFSPIKVYEYMATGRPVVTIPLVDIPMTIGGCETTVRYVPGDPASLAQAVARLLADEPRRRRMGAVTRAWVLRERTWTANARRIVELFERCRTTTREAAGDAESPRATRGRVSAPQGA